MRNSEKRKLFCICFCVLSFLFVVCTHKDVYANSWKYINGEWYYVDDTDGQVFCNSFVDRDGSKYFLGADGKIVRNSFFEWFEDYYYAGPDGVLAHNEFIDIDYDIASRVDCEPGKYFFGENYKCYRKKGTNFKRKIFGQMFAIDENGMVLTGWLDSEGAMIDKEVSLTDGMYYADESGALYYNRWLDFNTDEGTYHMNDNTTILGCTDYDYLDYMWMYFDNDGKKIKSESTTDNKVRKINGEEYAFDENGVMITYFTKTGGLNYSQASNPSSLTSAKIYDGENGNLTKNSWLWLYPSKELDETEFNDQEMHWWYTDKEGRLVRNKIKEIDDKKYVFDGLGRMKAGFVLFDGSRHYVANYMPEDLESEDFIYTVLEGSKLHGQELSDIRYFGDDDKLDAAMETGDVQIELADGVYTFSFGKSGIAYGNRHTFKKVKDAYYINGLRLTAKPDMTYGILKIANNEYKLIDKNGKVKRGSRKVIKDDDGNYILMVSNEVVGYKNANELPNGDVDIKWRSKKDGEPAGFYYYHKDAESGVDKYHYGICLDPSVVTTLSSDDVDNIPKDMRVNFR